MSLDAAMASSAMSTVVRSGFSTPAEGTGDNNPAIDYDMSITPTALGSNPATSIPPWPITDHRGVPMTPQTYGPVRMSTSTTIEGFATMVPVPENTNSPTKDTLKMYNAELIQPLQQSQYVGTYAEEHAQAQARSVFLRVALSIASTLAR